MTLLRGQKYEVQGFLKDNNDFGQEIAKSCALNLIYSEPDLEHPETICGDAALMRGLPTKQDCGL